MMKLLCISAALFSFYAIRAESEIKVVLFPFREATIASRVESTAGKYTFKLGERFKDGDILLSLDDDDIALKEKQMACQMEFAQTNYKDKAELHKEKLTSDFELKKAEFDFKMAVSSHESAKLNLSHCKIKAPFAGKIVEFLTREFETVRNGQPLIKIIDDNQLIAVMNLPLGKLKPVSSPVSIKLTDGNIVTGKIYEISPQADHRTGTVRIRVIINNSDGKLRAGMTGILRNDK